MPIRLQTIMPNCNEAIATSVTAYMMDLFESGAPSIAPSYPALMGPGLLSLLLLAIMVDGSCQIVYCRRACGRRKRLAWLILDGPSTITVASGDNFEYNVLQCAILNLRHIYFARKSKGHRYHGRFGITPVGLPYHQYTCSDFQLDSTH